MHFEHFGLTDLSRIQIIYFRKRQKVEFKVRTQNLRQADVDENFFTKSLRQIGLFWSKFSRNIFGLNFPIREVGKIFEVEKSEVGKFSFKLESF